MSKKYDVIIIGAGIGGLVCGCFLAKAGIKTLIIEKNKNVGGYCSSFKIGDYAFDSVISGLVGGGRGGLLGKILDELGLEDEVMLRKNNPSHIIRMPDYEIKVMNDPLETEEILKRQFPNEAYKIRDFFKFLREPNFLNVLAKLRNMNFKMLIESYFRNHKLNSFWYMLRANTGISPSKSSALADILLCRGYIFDGGYYPGVGMQKFAESFLRKFESFGGELVYSQKVSKITTKNNRINGVVVESGDFLLSDYVVSNCDVIQTFTNLLKENKISRSFVKKLKKLSVSPSALVMYLGVDRNLKETLGECCSLWWVDRYLLDREYHLINMKDLDYTFRTISIFFPSFQNKNFAPLGKTSMGVLIAAPFKTKDYWEKNKEKLMNLLIKRTERIIPGISNSIELKEITTPFALYQFTLNHDGSSRGWATTLEQAGSPIVSSKTQIEGLFLTGHWVMGMVGGGVATTSHSGSLTAKSILKEMHC